MIDYRDKLRGIRTFPSLVKFLRDELDWPIDSTGDFEDITFTYTAEELGIDALSAAKIEEIKQLRRLASNQPWGIFFVKFEPKQLPVVALRRILNALAVKRRAMASDAEQKKWATDDLLFISNYGEDEERRISFAHFSQDPFRDRLPTLKVLAWDDLDTPLHLDYTANSLVEKLAWPASEDEWDDETWRDRWSSAFELRNLEVITTSKNLAVSLAMLARTIRDRIKTLLAIETEDGPVSGLMKAFQTALVHDLDTDTFADMYAQTIAYGLLTARITNPKANSSLGVAALTPVTNPFLKELLETFLGAGENAGGINFDELGVSDVVELLDHANMEAVVRDFGDKNPTEDPVIHFYELFLKEYDAKKRMQRGVFYTPRPVVSYIVRSVHELLQTEFGLDDGLADNATWGEIARRDAGLTIPEGVEPTERFVTVLDPATGTGTFLVEAIEVIHSTLVERWKRGGHGEKEIVDLWNDYVPAQLLPRLHGYELLMAPYAIAHLKIGLKLLETGYRFESDERARIYLTNALEPASDFGQQALTGILPALAHEAQAVNEIKRDQRFTVVLGNPPYAGHSANNQIQWIVDQVYEYRRGIPELAKPGQAKWLQDDYVKFLRFSQLTLERSSVGVLGMITSHSFLDNPTFRGMRTSLLGTFAGIDVINLNGNASERQLAPDGRRDENVFDIQQGVSISTAVRRGPTDEAAIRYRDLFGPRSEKYDFLSEASRATGEWIHVSAAAPHFAFLPEGDVTRAEYALGISLPDLMNRNGDPAAGIVTTHDQFAISWTEEEASEKVEQLLASHSETEARTLFRLCTQAQWNYQRAKDELRTGSWKHELRRVLYHPFDVRWTVFNRNVAVHRRERVMKHMLSGDNLALVTVRNVPPGATAPYALATRELIVNGAIRPSGSPSIDTLFPLYLLADSFGDGALPLVSEERTANLDGATLSRVAHTVGLAYTGVGTGDLTTTFGAEDVFHYVYACLYSTSYRTRYRRFLESEFPAIQFPADNALFATLAALGHQLVSVHLMETPKVNDFITAYTGPVNPEVGKVGWSDGTVWLNTVASKKGQPSTPGTIGFRGVPEATWNFQIGGFEVCQKWLKDRKGRTLTEDDIAHYQKIVVALSETIRLMREIDEVIEEHGGWPAAFVTQSGVS